MKKKSQKSLGPAKILDRHPIEPETLAAIGQIVLSVSNVDDLLSLFMFQLSRLSDPTDGFTMLGQLAISAKVARVSELLEKRGNATLIASFKEEKKAISSLLSARNAFAHGIYQGADAETGHLVFTFTSKSFLTENQPAHPVPQHEGVGFTKTEIVDLAKHATALVAELEFAWKLKEWRAIRYQQHRKVLPDDQKPRRS